MFISRAKIHPVCIGVKYWDILYQLLNSHSLPVPLVLVVLAFAQNSPHFL